MFASTTTLSPATRLMAKRPPSTHGAMLSMITRGVPRGGVWHERLNSDAPVYGGSGQGNLGAVEAAPLASHGHYHSLTLRLPPLGVLFLLPA